MKIEYIIETIKVAIAEVEWNYPFDYMLAFEEAIKLLKKHIPKEPLEITEKATNWRLWICPNCGEKWAFKCNYCHNCGQKIDWNNEGK